MNRCTHFSRTGCTSSFTALAWRCVCNNCFSLLQRPEKQKEVARGRIKVVARTSAKGSARIRMRASLFSRVLLGAVLLATVQFACVHASYDQCNAADIITVIDSSGSVSNEWSKEVNYALNLTSVFRTGFANCRFVTMARITLLAFCTTFPCFQRLALLSIYHEPPPFTSNRLHISTCTCFRLC